MNRRKFLLKGLAATGAAAAGAVAIERVTRPPALAPHRAARPSSDRLPVVDNPSGPAHNADPQLRTPPAGGPEYAGCKATPDGKLMDTATGRVHSMPLNVHDPRVRQGPSGKKLVMVIDLARCDGCGSCTRACAKMHFIPEDRHYIPVLRIQDSEFTAPYFFPKPCYHCDNPPCTKVCPTDATFKRQDGTVLIDNERCIGCRFCMAACPYGARSFNWTHPGEPAEAKAMPYSPETGFPRRTGTVEKCDFCPEMGGEGLLPPCASNCPMDVIWYGDQNEDSVTARSGRTEKLSKLLADNGGYRHKEELGTEPRVYYLPPKNRMYAPPAAPEKPHGHR